MMLLLENSDFVFTVLILISSVFAMIWKYITFPSARRKERILLWLVQAVEYAERIYGGKTGNIKLSFVYNMFIDKFGFVGMFVSQEVFNELVDKAIAIMEETLNESLKGK